MELSYNPPQLSFHQDKLKPTGSIQNANISRNEIPIASGSAEKPNKQSTLSTEDRLKILDQEYRRKNRLSKEETEKLSKDLGIDEKKIEKWFKKQRRKDRRLSSESINLSPPSQPKPTWPLFLQNHLIEKIISPETLSEINSVDRNNLRISLTEEKVKTLIEEYNVSKYKSRDKYRKLARDLGVDEINIRNWFNLQRYRENLLSCSSSSNKDSTRKYEFRALLTTEQVEKLKEEFNRSEYPSKEEYQKLAKDLGVREKRIINWFANRRVKKKKKLQNKSSKNLDMPSLSPLQDDSSTEEACIDHNDVGLISSSDSELSGSSNQSVQINDQVQPDNILQRPNSQPRSPPMVLIQQPEILNQHHQQETIKYNNLSTYDHQLMNYYWKKYPTGYYNWSIV